MNYWQMAQAIRGLSVDMTAAAGPGHPGMVLGAADIMTPLFVRVMNYDPVEPT